MKQEAHRLAVAFSREPSDFEHLQWLLLMRQHEDHGRTIATAELDRVIGYLSYVSEQPYEMVPTLAYAVLWKNPGAFDDTSRQKIFSAVRTMLDAPANAQSDGTVSNCLTTLSKLHDPRGASYFDRYRNDSRLLVHNAVAAHFKRVAHG